VVRCCQSGTFCLWVGGDDLEGENWIADMIRTLESFERPNQQPKIYGR